MHRAESLVSFLCKHDVIKIGQKQKGNVLHVVQPTTLQHSVCMLFNTLQLDTCSKLPATFAFFPVLSRGYAHAQLTPLYLLSTFGAFHVTKNTRLSTPAQLQCSHSGAWEPGNEASIMHHLEVGCQREPWAYHIAREHCILLHTSVLPPWVCSSPPSGVRLSVSCGTAPASGKWLNSCGSMPGGGSQYRILPYHNKIKIPYNPV